MMCCPHPANRLEFSFGQLIFRFRILAKKTATTPFAFGMASSQLFLIFLKMIFWRIASVCTLNADLYNGLEVVSCGFGKKTHPVMTGGMSKFVFSSFYDHVPINPPTSCLRHTSALIKLLYIFSFILIQLT